ncbi:MAG: hypothetical protein ACLU9X_00115 [Alistipes shahii]
MTPWWVWVHSDVTASRTTGASSRRSMALLHSGCSIDISVDAQYVFHLGEGWSVYPAVGFTANDIGKWAAGLNIGGGFDFEVARNWDLSAGLKWQPMFDDWRKNPVVISIGAAYKF